MPHKILILFTTVFCFHCFAEQIDKPKGCYSSMLTKKAALNPLMQGALIRITWAQIEPKPGQFDFSGIEQQLRLLPEDKNWSLAVYAGWTSIAKDSNADSKKRFNAQTSSKGRSPFHSPPWMVSELGIKTFTMPFRGQDTEMPMYWDPMVQKRLAMLMTALSDTYKSNPRLKLVYVPQMTSNGIEGHFNGVSKQTLLSAAGLDADDEEAFQKIWTEASLSAIRSTAQAFDNKAIALEVHELLGNASIAKNIMAGISHDPALKNQVGIGMWWLSGKTTYQADLIDAIESFSGDVYAQVIGRSDQTSRFPNGDYTVVFEQAKRLGIRYIEVWNYEFENKTYDALISAFNLYCEKKISYTP